MGTIRCTRAANGAYYKLSRLAVLKDFRRFRFGAALVLFLNDYVRADARARAAAVDADADAAAASEAISRSTSSGPRANNLSDAAAPAATVPVVCHSQIPVKGFYGK